MSTIFERMMADRVKRRHLVAYEMGMEAARLCLLAKKEGLTKEEFIECAAMAWDNLEEALAVMDRQSDPEPRP